MSVSKIATANSQNVKYTPAVPGDWSPVPANTKEALDNLKANSGGGGGGSFPSPSVSQTLYVSKGGNDSTGTGTPDKPFLTPHTAINSVLDASPDKIYSINIGPGEYEVVGDLYIKPYVFLIGQGENLTKIVYSEVYLSDSEFEQLNVWSLKDISLSSYESEIVNFKTINFVNTPSGYIILENCNCYGQAYIITSLNVATYIRRQFSNNSESLNISAGIVRISDSYFAQISVNSSYQDEGEEAFSDIHVTLNNTKVSLFYVGESDVTRNLEFNSSPIGNFVCSQNGNVSLTYSADSINGYPFESAPEETSNVYLSSTSNNVKFKTNNPDIWKDGVPRDVTQAIENVASSQQSLDIYTDIVYGEGGGSWNPAILSRVSLVNIYGNRYSTQSSYYIEDLAIPENTLEFTASGVTSNWVTAVSSVELQSLLRIHNVNTLETLNIEEQTDSILVDMPDLIYCTNLNVSNNVTLSDNLLYFPSLEGVQTMNVANTSLTGFYLPELTSGSMLIQGTLVEVIDIPKFTSGSLGLTEMSEVTGIVISPTAQYLALNLDSTHGIQSVNIPDGICEVALNSYNQLDFSINCDTLSRLFMTSCNITGLNINSKKISYIYPDNASLSSIVLDGLEECVNGSDDSPPFLDFNNSSFPESVVDYVLEKLAGATGAVGSLSLNGSFNAPPSAAGLANAAILISLGWTVDTN